MAITQVSNSLVKQDLTISGGTVDNTVIGSGTPAAGTFTTIAGTLASAVAATTQAANDNSTKVATTAYVTTALANLVDSAPGTLNTLNELAAALGDDASFSTTVTNSIATKLPLAGGTMTGDIVLGDNRAVKFGTGSDTSVYNDGSNFYIKNNTSNQDIIFQGNDDGSTGTTALTLDMSNAGAATFNSFVYLDYIRGKNDTNTGINIAGSDVLELQTGGSARVTVDASGKVGIGGTPTDGTLHVLTASAGTVAASTQADDIVIENNAEGGMTIITPDDQSARIRFTSPSTNTDVGGASIFYRQNINKMNIGTEVSGGILALHSGAGNETMRLDSSGNVAIGTTNTSVFNGIGLKIANATAARLLLQDSTNGVGATDGFAITAAGTDAYIWNQESGFLSLATSATERLHITAAGQVGIGTSGTKGLLHVYEGNSGQGSANGNFDKLVLEDSSHSGMTILGGANTHGAIYFGDPDVNDVGQIKYKHNEDSLDFTTNSQERMTILSSGVVDFMYGTHTNPDSAGRHVYTKINRTNGYDGHVVFYESGTPQWQQVTDSSHNLRFYSYQNGAGFQFSLLSSGGIAFGTDTSQSNALDDYEEGVHNVGMAPSSTGSIGLGANDMAYTKVGRLVTCTAYLSVNSASSSRAGYVLISLPFTITNGNQFSASCSLSFNGLVSGNTLEQAWGIAVNNTNYVRVYKGGSTGAASTWAQAMQAGTDLRITVSFMTS